MTSPRLVCHVNAPDGEDLPDSDDHPYWLGLDDLGDTIAASFKARGLDPDAKEFFWANDEGSLLTMSSDAPRNVSYFWIYLPADPALQGALLSSALVHLARARDALPGSAWNVSLDDRPLVWADGRFHLLT